MERGLCSGSLLATIEDGTFRFLGGRDKLISKAGLIAIGCQMPALPEGLDRNHNFAWIPLDILPGWFS